MTRSRRLLAALLPVAGIAAFAQPALAANPECRVVRMSDPGWTDITSTNAVFGNLLAGLGYERQVESIAVSITFQALKNGDIDVFLGNWMPSQTTFIEPLTAEGAIEVIAPNLQGIRFTLAVPDHVSEAGVTDFADLADHAEEFESTIYGIEPGAPANRHIQRMIDTGDFGLGDWTLVESSEQGMLSQVDRAERRDEWVVFLAWEPHPMNMKYDITYLSGGDEYFGPNYGSATVNTVTRTGYVEECPNIGKLLEQLQFTVEMENEIMAMILDEGMEPMDAAAAWLEQHPEVLEPWLQGVTTIDGAEGLPAVKAHLGLG
ncbi:choline ABC transporter substrate-binding protein [Inquilinus sp. CAU 1745]|uniref:choline ABC transporter substrate-binding protein n=1 Tax=Inquilinus sp. CAU 1745 TaxID=3140369 RepID=UPI00325B9FC1